MLFFEVLPFTTLAVSVNSKTSKKSMHKSAAFFFFLVCLGPYSLLSILCIKSRTIIRRCLCIDPLSMTDAKQEIQVQYQTNFVY